MMESPRKFNDMLFSVHIFLIFSLPFLPFSLSFSLSSLLLFPSHHVLSSVCRSEGLTRGKCSSEAKSLSPLGCDTSSLQGRLCPREHIQGLLTGFWSCLSLSFWWRLLNRSPLQPNLGLVEAQPRLLPDQTQQETGVK